MKIRMNRTTVIAVAAVVAALLLPARFPGATPAQGGGVAADTISGKVMYSGPKPVLRTISMDANAACSKLHPKGLPSPEVILNPDNSLQNVVVYVKSGLFGRQYPPVRTPLRVDQKGCMFTPRLIELMVDQPLEITNGDPTNHNIHVIPEVNQEVNLSQPPGSPAKVSQFPKAEIGIPVMCNIHPWMRLYVHVFANPFHAVTGQDGTFTIQGLAPGQYTLEAWHERYGVQERKLKTGSRADFTFTE